MKRRLTSIILLYLLSICVVFAQTGNYDWKNPTSVIGKGVYFASVSTQNPNLNVFCAKIDTSVEGLKFYTTPKLTNGYTSGVAETKKETTRNFIRRFQGEKRRMICAINADFFTPWPAPNQEDPANLLHLAVSDGVLVSEPAGTPSFIVTKDGKYKFEVTNPGYDISNVWVAVSGNVFCLLENNIVAANEASSTDRHPRTVIGMSSDSRYVYFLVIDGRRFKSIGANMFELGNWAKYFGAYSAINLDGGGSSTMAYLNRKGKKDDMCELLNSPNSINFLSQTPEIENATYKIQERNVGNNLGVYFEVKEN